MYESVLIFYKKPDKINCLDILFNINYILSMAIYYAPFFVNTIMNFSIEML